jgi:hypothetical protein
MKTISYEGRRYQIAFIFGNQVVVELPPTKRWSQYGRMPIPFSSLTKRQRIALRKLQATV